MSNQFLSRYAILTLTDLNMKNAMFNVHTHFPVSRPSGEHVAKNTLIEEEDEVELTQKEIKNVRCLVAQHTIERQYN